MSISQLSGSFTLLNPRPEHFLQIQELCKKVYPFSKPWSLDQLEAHRAYFPDGQLIVVDNKTGKVVGLAFSLIIVWDDYLSQDSWQDFTASGYFHNHNPRKGKTLYGAEVMVDPELRGQGIGKLLYEGRKYIVEKYNLKKIRAGARLRGYSKFKDQLTPDEYVKRVSEKKIYDPTLSFQLNQDFKVIDVAPNYLFNDPESLGFAAVIEWLNPKVATEKDYEKQKQSMATFFAGHKYVSEHLPRELRRLVRKATYALGKIIKDYEGEGFYSKVEYYREQLKKTRNFKNKPLLLQLQQKLKSESKANRLKLAHAFALQLELVNICEASYRTWRQRLKVVPQGTKSKLKLTYVLTAHPTEARTKLTVEVLNHLENLLIEGIQSDFLFNENELMSQMRMLWLLPFSKTDSPSVLDEAEYIYSLIFSEKLFDFILGEKPSYEIELRSWVGGDKDGHPYVNREVMKECFNKSRGYILKILTKKLESVISDANKIEKIGKLDKNEIRELIRLVAGLSPLKNVSSGDGTKLKTWRKKYQRFMSGSSVFLKMHNEISLINRILEVFPAFVFPIELREDSSLIQEGLKDNTSIIRGMLSELKKIAGVLEITSYAKGLVISHCESADDMSNACSLVESVCESRILPVIPLFETKEALVSSKKIVKSWLGQRRNHELVTRQWSGNLEIMLGYSDSAKQLGALPSRFLISKAMIDLEKVIKSYDLRPHFFHGSGGSVARGGGSLKEQIAWWSNSAVANPKFTIQGEMIQRQFATKEILNSQGLHLASEALRRKKHSLKLAQNPALEHFVSVVADEYSKLVQGPLLKKLLDASPYRYLDILKIGSRPSKRPEQNVSISSLRAIPWVLCWTQTRILMPTWWGVGTAWKGASDSEKKALIELFKTNPFLSSFVKTLGFSLAKVELKIWELYFGDKKDQKLFDYFEREYNGAVDFVRELSQEKELIWFRPWLEESIRLRSSNIHVLNLLQIISLETNDEALLKETIVGIACGMLTTG
jgi:phosphoenolpyruvate carboxylase